MASSSLSSLCLSKPVGGKLSSSLFNSSPLSFSSSIHNNSLHFFSDNLKPTFSSISSTPRPLTIISMAPPKPGGGKPKKGTLIYLFFNTIPNSHFGIFDFLDTIGLLLLQLENSSNGIIWGLQSVRGV